MLPQFGAFEGRRAVDIDDYEDLRLFRVGKERFQIFPTDPLDYIWFPCATGDKGFTENKISLNHKEKILQITIECEPHTAKRPRIFRKEISAIIQIAKIENA